MDETRKIFVVSLADKRRFMAWAAFNGEQLVVHRMEEIKGAFSSWKAKIIQEVKTRVKEGFSVLVEEKTDYIARHGRQFLLDDVDEWDGRINYFVAMDWFYALEHSGNLVVPTSATQYKLKDSIAEKEQDEKGRIKYNINWSTLNGGHRAIMLCVMAAVENSMSETFIAAMFPQHKKKKGFDPARTWETITQGVDKDLEEHRTLAIDKREKQLEEYRKTNEQTQSV